MLRSKAPCALSQGTCSGCITGIAGRVCGGGLLRPRRGFRRTRRAPGGGDGSSRIPPLPRTNRSSRMSAVLKSKSVKERVSKEEWDLRVDLAAAYQLAAIFKWTDWIFTHFSARLPGHDEFLINPYGLMFEEITASNLIKIDHDGKVMDDTTGLGYEQA